VNHRSARCRPLTLNFNHLYEVRKCYPFDLIHVFVLLYRFEASLSKICFLSRVLDKGKKPQFDNQFSIVLSVLEIHLMNRPAPIT